MRIDRPDLDSKLRSFAKQSGLVIGAPGGGKSYSLRELLLSFDDPDRAAAVMLVTTLRTADEAELRTVYGYKDADFIAFLRRYGQETAERIVVFDGFDAARDPELRSRVLQLIQRTVAELPEWVVIVSVREYDAQISADLLRLFPASDSEGAPFFLPNVPCRHFFVPPLSRDEVFGAIKGAGELLAALEPTEDLLDLLRTPFNFRILERVAEAEGDLRETSQFDYQIQLLRQYWTLRVSGAAEGEETEECLGGLVRSMVDRRTLTVSRRERRAECPGKIQARLLSEGVLSSAGMGGRRIGFGHNILFDFAVQALLMDDDAESVASLVAADKTRALSLRPSLALHFAGLWAEDRNRFWASYRSLRKHPDEAVRFVGKYVPSAVIAENARCAEDLGPLLDESDGDEGADAVRAVLQAKQALEVERDEAWLGFLVQLAQCVRVRFVNELARRANEILHRTAAGDAQRLELLNGIGHSLLGWAMAPEEETGAANRSFVKVWVLPLIIRTYRADPVRSRQALEPFVAAIGTPGMELECVSALCDGVGDLAGGDPDLVARLYETVFSNREESQEKTVLTRGVLSLSSNRAQDYQMCRYSLAQGFPKFLQAAPVRAIGAASTSISADGEGRQVREAGILGEIYLAGRLFPLRKDYWAGRNDMREDYVEQIAVALNDWLASPDRTDEEIDSALASIADTAPSAPALEVLLEGASSQPAKYASRLAPALASPALLSHSGLHDATVSFLRRASTYFGDDDRRGISAAIESLPNTEGYKEMTTSRLLAALNGQLGPDANEESAAPGIAVRRARRTFAFIDDDRIDSPPEQESPFFREIRALKALNESALNSPPDIGSVRAVLAQARAVACALSGEAADTGLSRVEAGIELARFARAMLATQAPLTEDELDFASSTTLSALPPDDPPDQDDGTQSLGWTPTPAVEAASTLPLLYERNPTTEVEGAMRSVIDGPSAALRFNLVNHAHRLALTNPALFWEIVRSAYRDEFSESRACAARVAGALRDTPEAEDFVRWSVTLPPLREPDREGDIASLLAYLAFNRGTGWSVSYASFLARSAVAMSRESAALARAAVAYINSPNVTGNAVWKAAALRARGHLLESVAGCSRGLGELAAAGPLDATGAKLFRDTYGIVDNVAARLHFALTMEPNLARDGRNPKCFAEQKQTFRFAEPLMRSVASFEISEGQPYLQPSTAHHLLQTLAECVGHDPASALRMAHSAIRAGHGSGYTSDSLGVREAVKLVEALVADHKEVLMSEEGARLTRDLLDMFVENGSAEALRLAWRLESAFR
jgi:hypothetical protein